MATINIPDTDIEVLHKAVLRAKAETLTEVRKNQIQATAYNDRERATVATRAANDAQRRYDALDALGKALADNL